MLTVAGASPRPSVQSKQTWKISKTVVSETAMLNLHVFTLLSDLIGCNDSAENTKHRVLLIKLDMNKFIC